MGELTWSDAQWQKVKDSVTEAFGKASVATAFLPCYGPLAGSAEIVRNERLKYGKPPGPRAVTLDTDHDDVNLKLVNLSVNVVLSSEQVADETLSNATLAFRRAANILAQEQDLIVFAGFGRGAPDERDSEYATNRIGPQRGLADLPARRRFFNLEVAKAGTVGRAVVSAAVEAIHRLEDRMHPAPFACVLGNELFDRVHDPSEALVLPADRIAPLLKGGPLLRSGRMAKQVGIVVSLAGNAVDIVVGTPPTVQFLQRREDAKFVFRVYERFILRIREGDDEHFPVVGFRVPPTLRERKKEAERVKALVDEAASGADSKKKLAAKEVKVAEFLEKSKKLLKSD